MRTSLFAALTLLIAGCAGWSAPAIPPLHDWPNAAARKRSAATFTIEVPSPDPHLAKTARMTVRQQNRSTYHAEIGLVPGGHGCKQAPVVGIRCSLSVRLASGNVQYTIEILDGHGEVRYTRTASLPQYYLSGGLTFLIYDRWQRVAVNFDAPTMGKPATIPLVVSAYYEDDKRQIDGILVGPQTLQKSMTLVDSDKSGATHLLGSTTLHSLADGAALYYDGKSFVNPTISVAGYLRASRHLLVPFLRVHEYAVPS